MSGRPKLRRRDRAALALVAMTLAAAASEWLRAWPSGETSPGFALLLVTQGLVLSALWTTPLAVLFAAVAWARDRTRASTSGDAPTPPGGSEADIAQAGQDAWPPAAPDRAASARPASERAASERSASERASERAASERAAELAASERSSERASERTSERSASERASELAASERTSEWAASERTSERSASERASERSASERAASERAASDQAASARMSSERPASERSPSEDPAPERAAASGRVAALDRATAPGRRRSERLAFLVWVGPVAFLQISAGTALLGWSARAFVRQDLAAAVMPAALLAVFALIGAAGWAVHRLARGRVAALPPWAIAAIGAGGAVAAAGVHLARFPAVLDDAALPLLIQLATVGGLGAALFTWVTRLPFRPGWPLLAAHGVLVAGLAIIMLFGGRVAPLSYPVASAALQGRGLMAARIAPVLARAGDRDGDRVSAWFGGGDCDDGDPGINPLAAELPGNGVDEDCFEGDLARAEVERDRSARAAQRRPPRQRARNAVLITVDALRADAVGFAGGRKRASQTPQLDRLAARSAVFTSAWTQAPMTRKAFPSLLSGRYPSNLQWLDLRDGSLYPVCDQDNVFAAEVAQSAGIDTGLVVGFSYPVLGRFNQGFRLEKIHPASRFKDEINANVVVDDGIRAIEGWARDPAPGGRRFFLWLHFYEAHYPYVAHAGLPGPSRDARGRYASEVRYVDDQIGRFLRRLEELGLADQTAILFTSDHGEEFGEHGGQWHGDLYPEDLRVPLLVHVPGSPARRIDAPARLIDVAPTLLDALGLPAPDGVDGESLIPWLDGATPEQRLVFAELIPDAKVKRRLVAAVDRGWLLVADFALGTRELYDLERDPAAQDNRLVEAPERAREVEVSLRRHMALRVGPLRTKVAPRAGRRK